jgi:hypothetical protein
MLMCAEVLWSHQAHMKNDGVVVTVSLQKIFRAEARIVGCNNCSDRATIHFERLFDDAAETGTKRLYLLPKPAMCPFCHAAITEKTLIELLREEKYQIARRVVSPDSMF